MRRRTHHRPPPSFSLGLMTLGIFAAISFSPSVPRSPALVLGSYAWMSQVQSIERSMQREGHYGTLNKPSTRGDRQKVDEKILKQNFEKLKHDVDDLTLLAKSLQEDLLSSNENVFSLALLEKAEKIEKLAKDIKKRAKGF